MKSLVATLIILLTIGLQAFPQRGRMLLVGGGAEKNNPNGWSTPAYRWAAEGKRVAVIGTSTGSLAPYLTRYCGAAYAREFAVATRDSADSQFLYDTLMTYQMIFFRGGDQYEYYDKYRNTKLQEAAETIFSNGGTIGGTSAGMHILSSVLFTAEKGSVYPYEAIENPHNKYMTLADDFFDFFPGYLFDTHFSERARFGRLAGFLAKYDFDHGTVLTGLGMDDMTCMTVDTNNIGTAYGTGCANIYKYTVPFQLNGYKLLHPGMEVTQLIQGCTYDFNTGEFTTPTMNRMLETSSLEETGNFTLLASGGSYVFDNYSLISELVKNCGEPSDDILLLSGNPTTAQSFSNRLLQEGSGTVDIFMLDASNGSNAELTGKINTAKKILFAANTTEGLHAFLATSNGRLLHSRLKAGGLIMAFAGDDARFAGKTIVDNYYTELASWNGKLQFSPGLGLLKHSIIMPNTYFSSDIYENTATAVPYAMALDTLRYGIWLTSKNFMKIMPVDDKTTLFGYGIDPVMILRNEGGACGFVTQTGTGTSGTTPRMEAGFESLTFSLTDETLPYIMGDTEALAIPETKAPAAGYRLLGNPVRDELRIEAETEGFGWEIFDMQGRRLLSGNQGTALASIDVSGLKPGIYNLILTGMKSGKTSNTQFVKL